MNSKILEIINELKRLYLNLGLTEEEINSITKEYFSKKSINKEKSTQEEFLALLKEELLIELNQYILVQINLQNYQIVLNHINKNIIVRKSKKGNIQELKKLSEYFKLIGIEPDIDLYNALIADSETIKDMISTIVAESPEIIEKGQINKLSKSDLVNNLVELFCVNNSLSNELESEDDYLENFNEAEMIPDSYKQYLNDIQRKPLTPEEEKAIWEKIVAGDKEAKKAFIEHNLLLVISVARKYRHSTLDLLDLVQEGNTGLLKAVEKFDPKKGNKFSTYAVWWIRQSITRSMADNGRTIRIPVHQTEKIMKYQKAIKELQAELKDEPNKTQIRERLGWTETELINVEKAARDVVSLNQSIGEESDMELVDMIASENQTPEEEALTNLRHIQLLKMFIRSSLSKKEIYVLGKRYGIGDEQQRTLEQVAQLMGVTRERIRQIEAKALRKIRTTRDAKTFNNEFGAPIKINQKNLISSDYEGISSISDDTIEKIVKIMWQPKYDFLNKGTKPFKNSLIFGLKYGAYEGKKYSTLAIAELFQTDTGSIRTILKSTLELLYKNLEELNVDTEQTVLDTDAVLKKLFN